MSNFIKKIKNKNIYWAVVAFLLFSPVTTVMAGISGTGVCPPNKLCNPIKYTTISQFLAAMLDALSIIMLPFIILVLVYAGFLFVSAQGNEEKIKKARSIFFWTIIGALIILGASVLVGAIGGTINQIRV